MKEEMRTLLACAAQAHPEARGEAIVHIFRLEDRKIVKHCDVIQPVPETTANPDTMA